MADSSTIQARLSSYRPLFDRVLFGIALVGVLVAVHLLIQQGRGFDRGCLGFSEPAAAAQADTFNCELVTQSRAGTLLGISNAWWGIGFYLAVAGLSAAAASLAHQRLRFAATRAVLIGGGLLYSAYLTYHQFAGLGALCALCLTSAAIALVLFLVQAALLAWPAARSRSSSVSGTASAMTSASSSFHPARWGGAALALLVLIGADVTYFSNLEDGAPEVAEAAEAAEPTASGGAASAGEEPPSRNTAAEAPARADTTEKKDAAAGLPPGCRYEPGTEPVPASQMVNFGDPIFGEADAPVTVVEFFDPNCPHCKEFHPVMKRLMAQYGDQARFVYKPFLVIGPQSFNQISALYSAVQQGHFMDMLDAQFARQQRGGLSNDQLAGIARKIGMNPGPMLAQIRQNKYRQRILRDRKKGAQAGVTGTPAVSINGRLVGRRARTPRCVRALVKREIEQVHASSSGK